MRGHNFKLLRRLNSRRKAIAAGCTVSVAISMGLWASADSPLPDGDLSAAETALAGGRESAAKLTVQSVRGGISGATLEDALQFGQTSLAALQPVADYTAVFTKTELIDGKLVTQTMDFKCRRQPFSVYLRNHRRRGNGREVIYVAGANDGNLLVHEAGLKSVIGTLKLKPDSAKVMETNRHPITDVGLVRLIESAMSLWEIDRRIADPAHVGVRFDHNVNVGTAVCDRVQITHHEKREKISYQIGRVSVDQSTGLPIEAEVYGWPRRHGDPPPLLEKYTYTEIKTNVGLTDQDFDPQNSEYQFVSRD